jgi:uncharacterized protein YjiS (DUF1127 family)
MAIVQIGACRTTAVGRQDRRWLRALQRAADRVLTWHERVRQRRQLECLSDRMLRDIGLTRADVMAEATKRFWEA